MTKTKFHTYDFFDFEDAEKAMKFFNFCHKKALGSGLTCKCIIDDQFPTLELWGTKYQFVNYYLQTLTKCEHVLDGVKCLLSFLLEK